MRGPVHAPRARTRRAVRGGPAVDACSCSGCVASTGPASTWLDALGTRGDRVHGPGRRRSRLGGAAIERGSRRIADGCLPAIRSSRTELQLAEAGSRYKMLVEHVPAAVYIDMADVGVTDGGRLAYMSPQIRGILGFRPEEFMTDPELWPSRLHPDDRAAALAAYVEHWRTGQPLRAEYRMLARDGTRGLGPRRGVRDARGDDHRPIRVAGPHRRHDRPQAPRGAAPPRALHDPLTGSRQPGPVPRSRRALARSRGGAAGRASPCSSSTSTTSRSSTTRSAIGPVTASSSRSPAGCRR